MFRIFTVTTHDDEVYDFSPILYGLTFILFLAKMFGANIGWLTVLFPILLPLCIVGILFTIFAIALIGAGIAFVIGFILDGISK